MKRIFLIAEIILLTVVVALAGCASKPVERIITKTETTLITIPESFLEKCVMSSPPLKDKYMASTPQQKEKLLADYGTALQNDLALCDNKITKIKDFQEKQKKSYEEKKGTAQ